MGMASESRFEYNRGPVLWGAVTMAVSGLLVNFVIYRPGWLLPAAFVAGLVAAGKSGFYEPSGTNGVLGTTLGLLLIIPILSYPWIIAATENEGTIDLVFLTTTFSVVSVLVLFPLLIMMAYFGTMLADFTRQVFN